MAAHVFAQRLQGVSESATLKLNALVQELKQQGQDIVNLTAGEPDFAPPEAVKEAVIDAVRRDQNRYTPVPGLPELRRLIAERTNSQQPELARQQPWGAPNVVVSNGGKQAIFSALQALVDPGDAVLIPAPYWLSYPEMTKLAQGRPVILATEAKAGWKLAPSELSRALDQAGSRARVLILNSPSNPTGILCSRAELTALGEVVRRHAGARDLWVISDEIYDSITFDNRPFCSFLSACPELAARTVTINGLSKRAAMTGWRVGWSVASAELTQALQTLQGQATSGINSLAQWASIAALKLPEEIYRQHTLVYERRRNLALEILGRSPKIKLVRPEGAFYAFLGIGAGLKPGEDSMGFCERALTEALVALVPGTPFGAPDHVRMSFALDDATLRRGCERLVEWLK